MTSKVKKGRVTIVTPVYNQAAYVEETIKSVLSQTYRDLEYIIIDDGSDDGSSQVVDRFVDRASVRHQPNRGQSATLNRGWAEASGEFIGYLSSDDLLDENAIELLVRVLKADEGLSVVYPDYRLIDENGRLVREVRTKDFAVRDLDVGLVCQPGVGALYRRKVFDASGGWNEALRQVADFEFFLRMSASGRFKRVGTSLGSHRVHASSASFRSISPQRSDEIVEVAERYWSGREEAARYANEAISNALVISARMHARSGRVGSTVRRYLKAVRRRPHVLLDVRGFLGVLYQLVRPMVFAIIRR